MTRRVLARKSLPGERYPHGLAESDRLPAAAVTYLGQYLVRQSPLSHLRFSKTDSPASVRPGTVLSAYTVPCTFRDFLISEETVFRGFSSFFRILSGISGI
jgi:hypothetical protein